MCTATHAHLGLGGRVETWVWLVVQPVVGLTSFCCLTLSAPLLPQLERQLAALQQAGAHHSAAVERTTTPYLRSPLSEETFRTESRARTAEPRLPPAEAAGLREGDREDGVIMTGDRGLQ